MPKDSTQKKLGRVRPPRVHITYDVEVGDAIEKRELPFVVGVFSDLSGQRQTKLPKLGERKFAEVDSENFDLFLAKQEPRLVFGVKDKLTNDDSELKVQLKFNKLEDFRPDSVAKQIEPLRKLVELRSKLSNLRSELYGNDALEAVLKDAIKETESLRAPGLAAAEDKDH